MIWFVLNVSGLVLTINLLVPGISGFVLRMTRFVIDIYRIVQISTVLVLNMTVMVPN